MQKEAMDHNKRHRTVERNCFQHQRYFFPNCNHTHLFFNDEQAKINRKKEFIVGKPIAPWLTDNYPYCNNTIGN